MERLCGGADKLAAHLRAAADLYRVTDARAARVLDRIASGH